MDDTLGYNQILDALRVKREQIEEAILTIERLARAEARGGRNIPAQLPSAPAQESEQATPARKKHRISAAGRKRIAEATRKRWAAKRAAEAAASKGSAGRGKKATAKRR